MPAIHFVSRAIDVYPICGVYKNRTGTNKTIHPEEVTCKSCLRWDMAALKRYADINDIYDITRGL